MSSELARMVWGARRAEMDVKCSAMRERRGQVFIFNLFSTWMLVLFFAFWSHTVWGLVTVFLFATFALAFDIDVGWERLTRWRR